MFVYIIQTFDGPSVYGPFDTEEEAFDAAYNDLVTSGIVQSREEAENYYETEADVWVKPIYGAGSIA